VYSDPKEEQKLAHDTFISRLEIPLRKAMPELRLSRWLPAAAARFRFQVMLCGV
jgi:hypothetical protein